MGFGSYDESEQERQQTKTQEEDTQNHRDEESDYDGEVSFSTDSVDELLNQFSEVKESDD